MRIMFVPVKLPDAVDEKNLRLMMLAPFMSDSIDAG